ncbi:MAG: tyrosine-type recombinase/integrase [Planctomycetes bacterium]|nr:tyrosine-type recombinase/integrase [Planctomycetota bacterium]
MKTLREASTEYVKFRRAFGTKFYDQTLYLGHFVTFLEKEKAEFITTNHSLIWAQQPCHVLKSTWAKRLNIVRRFALWLYVFDSRTEIPPSRYFNVPHQRKAPHIYTTQEIAQLMQEAMKLSSRLGLLPLTITTIIGTLASTGLRPGEVVALNLADVNLIDYILTVRDTKFGKSRFVPISNSTARALGEYAILRDTRCRKRECDSFFISEKGTMIQSSNVRRIFAKISIKVGLRPNSKGDHNRKGPRLQDFRHSFVTKRLVEWYRQGIDVERELPKLSTYLGHLEVGLTYWYIEAIPELLQLATDRVNPKTREMLSHE